MFFDLLAHLPAPSEKRLALNVRPNAEREIKKGHPWLFDQAITKQNAEGAAGDLAVIFDDKRRFVAVGLYDPDSAIRVKILQHNQPANINQDWFLAKLTDAIAGRSTLGLSHTTGYRLVHGENDGLPALIIDRYADTLVIKLYSAAWIPHLRALLPALHAAYPTAARWVLRLSRTLQNQPELCYGLRDGQTLLGDAPSEPIIFAENGLRFAADVINGHKTGFFFDQRDNRALVETLAKGRRVLDVFAYSGAFSLYAARGGAKSILSVDASAEALKSAAENFTRNADQIGAVRPETQVGDAFALMKNLAQARQKFDLVILDPPAFAKQQGEIERALVAYAHLTRLALPLLASDGLLVMASCSSRVSAADFQATIERAAQAEGRPLRVQQRTGHALDHPIRFPEGAYLKCVVASPRN